MTHDYFSVLNHQVHDSALCSQTLQQFLTRRHDATPETNDHKNRKNPSYSEISYLVTDKSSLVDGQVGSYSYHILRLPLH